MEGMPPNRPYTEGNGYTPWKTSLSFALNLGCAAPVTLLSAHLKQRIQRVQLPLTYGLHRYPAAKHVDAYLAKYR